MTVCTCAGRRRPLRDDRNKKTRNMSAMPEHEAPLFDRLQLIEPGFGASYRWRVANVELMALRRNTFPFTLSAHYAEDRMYRGTLILAAAAFLTVHASAQQPAGPPVGPDWSKIEIKTTDLGNRTYMLEGFGGNITIAVGDDGVIMIDGQFAPLHDKLKVAIAVVTPQPVRFLVNTHYHRDHVGGNEPFSKDGAVVVAHENVRGRLAAGTTMAVPEVKYSPAPP